MNNNTQPPIVQPIQTVPSGSKIKMDVLLTYPFQMLNLPTGQWSGLVIIPFLISVGVFFAIAFAISKYTKNKNVIKIALFIWISGTITSFFFSPKSEQNE